VLHLFYCSLISRNETKEKVQLSYIGVNRKQPADEYYNK